MDLNLHGKVALVTGGSSGIGAATCRALAAEGCDVAVGFHANGQGAEQVATAIQAAGRRAVPLSMDMADPDSIRDATRRLREWTPQVDVLILCAGHCTVSDFSGIPAEEWDLLLNVNLRGPYLMIDSVAPMMSDGGAIVTVASVAGHTGVPHHPHYAAAKAGLINLTKSAARAGPAPRIRVNCVAPGMTSTEMGSQTATALDPDYARTKLLSGRFGQPDEIAAAIVCAASPRIGFMTGATIDVNGGRTLR